MSIEEQYMLINEINPDIWESDFKKKFSSFCKKCPVQVIMYIKVQDGERGAVIKHPNSASSYFFPIDYETDVKDFIADIKSTLVLHYPRLIKVEHERYEKTPEELADEAESGVPAEKLKAYGLKETSHTLYIIDKVMPWNDQVIIKVQTSDVLPKEAVYMYQFDKDYKILNFLKQYRTNYFSSIEDATEEFFANAKLIKELKKETKEDAVKSN